MAYTLIVYNAAENDAAEAYNWYEDQTAGIGELFLSELEIFYKKIKANPYTFSLSSADIRQATLRKVPYVIVYAIVQQEIHVFSVFHTSRNPKKKPGQ